VNPRRRVWIPGIVLICTIALIFIFRERILWSLGAMLDGGGPPQKADMIVVLGGDLKGKRILTAAQLARQGYAPKIFVSGVAEDYGHFESDLAIDYAVHHGYPAGMFIASHYPALSTLDEAEDDIREMRRLGVHRLLLVTSVYHTARANRIFRRQAKDLEIHAVSAPDVHWRNGQWWKDREGRKLWFTEVVKTVAEYLGV
jgi:uncharacterized SAM-binding protein YcdF (DUF218 family)